MSGTLGTTLFAYENVIRYDPALVDLTSNFFFLCTNVKFYLYNYSYCVKFSIDIHVGKG